MAEVTSGKNLTVIVLDEREAGALALLLHNYAGDDAIDGDPRLWELYNALVPTDEQEDDFAAIADGLPVDYYPVGGAA